MAVLKSSQSSLIRFQSLEIIFHGFQFHPWGSWFYPLSHDSFSTEEHVFSWVVSLTCFLPVESWDFESLLLFYALHTLVQADNVSAEIIFLKNTRLLRGFFTGFHSIKQKPHPQTFLRFLLCLWILLRLLRVNVLKFPRGPLFEGICEAHT